MPEIPDVVVAVVAIERNDDLLEMLWVVLVVLVPALVVAPVVTPDFDAVVVSVETGAAVVLIVVLLVVLTVVVAALVVSRAVETVVVSDFVAIVVSVETVSALVLVVVEAVIVPVSSVVDGSESVVVVVVSDVVVTKITMSATPDVVTLSALAKHVIVPIGMEPLTLSEALLPMMVKLQRTSASEQIEQFKSSMLEPSANTVS